MKLKTLEITTKIGCSLNCAFCPQKLLVNRYCDLFGGKNLLMTFECFKECIDKVPTDVNVDFSGMCEPWLNKDCTKMLMYAYTKGHKISVYTTLVGMKVEDYMQIRDLKYETFVLHIPDAENNSKFVLDEAYITLLKMVCKDIASGKLHVNNYSCHGKVHPIIKEIIDNTNVTVLSEMFDRAGNVEDDNVTSMDESIKGNIVCSYCNGAALSRNVLLPNGTVLVCCMDYGMKYILGNLQKDSYSEISEGEIKRELRRRLRSERNGEILCRNCHVAQNKLKWFWGKIRRRIRWVK